MHASCPGVGLRAGPFTLSILSGKSVRQGTYLTDSGMSIQVVRIVPAAHLCSPDSSRLLREPVDVSVTGQSATFATRRPGAVPAVSCSMPAGISSKSISVINGFSSPFAIHFMTSSMSFLEPPADP